MFNARGVIAVFAICSLAAVTLGLPTHLAVPPPEKTYNYTFQNLALTWPGSFCSKKQCDSGWMSKWNGYL